MNASRVLVCAFVLAFAWHAHGQEEIPAAPRPDESPQAAPPPEAPAAPRKVQINVWFNEPREETPEPPPPPPPAPPAKPPTAFRQVQMHVWISETTEQGLRNLGANLNYTRFVRGRENPTDALQQIVTNVFDTADSQFAVTLPRPDQSLFDAPLRPGPQTQSGAGLTFSIIGDDHGTIDGVFRSIEETGDADLISKPELLVIEGMTASINAGGEVPFQGIQFNNKGVGVPNVDWKEIGVNVKVVPTIRPDNLIQLNLQQLEVTEVARFDRSRGLELPVISKRSQTGIVLVPNGQTLVIGGLSSRLVRKLERRVPILGRIPLIGIPFRSRQSDVSNTHLLIFVAPTIVDLRKMTPASTNALRFWQESGWRNVERIEQEVRSLEDEL